MVSGALSLGSEAGCVLLPPLHPSVKGILPLVEESVGETGIRKVVCEEGRKETL